MVTNELDINDPEKNLELLMRRWTIFILKDMFLGAKRFNDFLKMNPHISGKVLSDQLKNLEKYGFIEKIIVSKTPLRAEYVLTEKGRGLNKMLYELMAFAGNHLNIDPDCDLWKDDNMKKCFGV